MEILRGYGLGTNLSRLLTNYCKRQRIVPNLGKFLGKSFGAGRGLTQVKPASPVIFNIVVDAVLRAVLDVVCGPQETQHGLFWAAVDRNLVFYAENVRIAGRAPK